MGFLILFGSVFLLSFWHSANTQPAVGPILFWQDDSLYTINPDGSDLKRITPALDADRRQVAVSPGCHGLVDETCWILVGHVLYHISGYSLPLPLTDGHTWLNSLATWAPDGKHLVYPAKEAVTGARHLLIYNTQQAIVRRLVENADDSIRPAWSYDCRLGLGDNCRLAYANKATPGQKGIRLTILDFGRGQTEARTIPSGRGNLLRWSYDDRLYFGRRNWYAVDDGQPLTAEAAPNFAPSPSPWMAYLAYPLETSSLGPNLTSCAGCNPVTLRLASAATQQPEAIYTLLPHPDQQGFNHPVFWSPDGERLAAFMAGQLVVHDLAQETASVWYKNQAIETLGSYAFSPDGRRLALVEGVNLDQPKRRHYRFLVVDQEGQLISLRSRLKRPIILLAWLPASLDSRHTPHQGQWS